MDLGTRLERWLHEFVRSLAISLLVTIVAACATASARAGDARPPANDRDGYEVHSFLDLEGGGELFLLDPFLLKAPDLRNLDLRALLPKLSSLNAARAD